MCAFSQVNITVIATGLNDDEYPAYFKRETETVDVKEKKIDKKHRIKQIFLLLNPAVSKEW